MLPFVRGKKVSCFSATVKLFGQIFATTYLYMAFVILSFKSDMHWGTCPTVSVLTGVQAGEALITAMTYKGPGDCCSLCKYENLRFNFPSQSSQDSSSLTINVELTHFTFRIDDVYI